MKFLITRLTYVCFCLGILSLPFSPGFVRAATIQVTSLADLVPVNTSDGACTLREAILVANSDIPTADCPGDGSAFGKDTILLGRGTYDVDISGTAEHAGANGDLDITDNLTLTGMGPQDTLINANPSTTQRESIFHIGPGSSSIDVNLSGLTIQNGTATNSGSGIFNESQGTVKLSDCMMTNNKSGGFGGAIQHTGNGTINIDHCAIDKNFSVSGGGIESEHGTLNISNSTINDNVSLFGGGGFFAAGTKVNMVNVTVSHNQSGSGSFGGGGGGLVFAPANILPVVNSAANLDHVTVTANVFDNDNFGKQGGGIANSSSTVNLKNSIVAGNLSGHTSPVVDNCFNTNGTFTSVGHNLEDGNSCGMTQGSDHHDPDPKLGPLQDNGGLTQTHALLPGSPALDDIPPADCTDHNGAAVPVDQRGASRPQGANCDIGAFERLAATSLSIGNAFVTEGNSGTTPATFTVTLSTPLSLPMTVNFATTDGTATAGLDYSTLSGTLTFNPGETTKTLDIAVMGDTEGEADETFSVVLSSPSPTEVSLAKDTGTGTILNDDTGNGFSPGSGGGTGGCQLHPVSEAQASLAGFVILAMAFLGVWIKFRFHTEASAAQSSRKK